MGTADIYAAVEGLADVADSLVIDLEDRAGGSTLLMFVVPRDGRAMDDPGSNFQLRRHVDTERRA